MRRPANPQVEQDRHVTRRETLQPSQYDLRKLAPLTITDQQHEIAKTIFNRRTTSTADLTEDDVPELESLGMADQVQVFVALFYKFGSKVGAMKYRTGIE